jgi:hypothetical protein
MLWPPRPTYQRHSLSCLPARARAFPFAQGQYIHHAVRRGPHPPYRGRRAPANLSLAAPGKIHMQ